MIVNRLTVRYRGGFTVVEDTASIGTYGVAAGFLAVGDIEDRGEAQRIGRAHLTRFAQPEEQIELTVDPRAAMPDARVWDDWDLGDYVTAPARDGVDDFRVVGLTISEDELGQIVVDPQLNTKIDEATIRTWRWLRRMAPGTLGGRSESATFPVPADSIITRRPLTEDITMSFAGPLVQNEVSPPWKAAQPGRLASGLAMLGVSDPAQSVQFELRKNGTVFATIDFEVDAKERVMAINEPWGIDDVLTLRIANPRDAESLTVKMALLYYE
jgi:hypothetical protein